MKQADRQAHLPFCLGSLEWGADNQTVPSLVAGWMALGSQMLRNFLTTLKLFSSWRGRHVPAIILYARQPAHA